MISIGLTQWTACCLYQQCITAFFITAGKEMKSHVRICYRQRLVTSEYTVCHSGIMYQSPKFLPLLTMQTSGLFPSVQFFAEFWNALLSGNSCTLQSSPHICRSIRFSTYRIHQCCTYCSIAVTDLLATDLFIIVIALNFSKAFDTVRHNALFRQGGVVEYPRPNL